MRRVFLALVVGVVFAPAVALAQASTGNINLHLAVPAGTGLTGTTLRFEEVSSLHAWTLDLISGPGPFAINGLAPGTYGVKITSQRFGGGVCIGANHTVPVAAGGTTILFASLTCLASLPAPAPGLGRYALLLAVFGLAAGVAAIHRGRRRAV